MRRFHSYGPVDCEEHFCVERKGLADQCVKQLIGNPEKSGHYFTVWAPRQTGKTWLMRQAKKAIEQSHSDRFTVGMMSVQGVVMKPDEPEEGFLDRLPLLFWETFKIEMDNPPANFEGFKNLFLKDKGLFRKPLILFIDEFDSLPRMVVDRLVTLFRDMYLKRESYIVHGLALVGVRAVLGVESERGSPFNIQRSLHVPNFTREEVEDLFRQYREDSGQKIEPAVVRSVYDATRGQPGLVGWFGELLTETYNPGEEKPVDMDLWNEVYGRALYSEWNNTVLNLVKKVRAGYLSYVVELFSHSDIRFSIDAEWCSYLYLNGVIDKESSRNEQGEYVEICRFSNPFVQRRLYNALALDLVGDRTPILAIEPLDRLSDVFDKPELDLQALLERYKNYLNRLKAKGIDPWKDQPRRTDMRLTEAVGHFHIYAWLLNAVGRRCGISPEFPTGNGRVDLHLRCGDKKAVIEVKSFRDLAELEYSKRQAAGYAKKLGMPSIAVALFVPVEDEAVLNQLSGETWIDGVRVFVSAIGWA